MSEEKVRWSRLQVMIDRFMITGTSGSDFQLSDAFFSDLQNNCLLVAHMYCKSTNLVENDFCFEEFGSEFSTTYLAPHLDFVLSSTAAQPNEVTYSDSMMLCLLMKQSSATAFFDYSGKVLHSCPLPNVHTGTYPLHQFLPHNMACASSIHSPSISSP